MRLFDLVDVIEYPANELKLEGLKANEGFSYVSSTYLNGFINYVKPYYAVVLPRYADSLEEFEKECAENIPYDSPFHFKFKECQPDDVIIIGKPKDSELNRHYIFYYDCDCSDCEIIRLDDVTEEKVIKLVEEWILYLMNEYNIPRNFDLNVCKNILPLLQGWVRL